jgi:phosphatidylserine/phosphatidylglycerophosphate/cardiolipin synthase-like enzyme
MRNLLVVTVAMTAACGSSQHRGREGYVAQLMASARGTSVFGPSKEWVPSPQADVGLTAMFDVRPPDQCEVAVLPGGEDSFTTRMALLQSATKSIRVEALIFTGDEAGLRVSEVLKQKKAAGVDVKVIVDSINNVSMQTQWMYFDLKQHGIEVEGYEALGLQLLNELPVPFLSSHQDPNKRYHEKVWIVDAGTANAQAVTGGLNIANEYFRIDPTNVPRYWRDQDVVIRGAIVDDLTTMFDRNYDHFQQIKKLRGGMTDAAWDATRTIMKSTGIPDIKNTQRDDLRATVAAFEARPPITAFKPARCRFLQSRPRLEETFILQAYLKLLDMAKREVLIANAYFVPTPAITAGLKAAASRCVHVVVLTNGPETNDEPGMNRLSRAHYADLLSVNDSKQVKACPNADAGLEIWEWRGQRADEPTRTQGLIHAKFALVDRNVSLVGSFNLDPRSESLNSESALVYENAELTEELAHTFLEKDLPTGRRITPQEAAMFVKADTSLDRFKTELAKMFEGQM